MDGVLQEPLLNPEDDSSEPLDEQALLDHALFSPGFTCRVVQPDTNIYDGDCDASPPREPESEPSEQPQWGRLLQLGWTEAHWIVAGLLALCLRLPFNLAMPHFISMAISGTLQVVHTKDTSTIHEIKMNVVYFFLAALGNAVLDFFNWNFFVIAQQRIMRKMRRDLLASLLAQDMGYFDDRSTGELVSRLTSDVGEMANDLTWVFRWSLEAAVRTAGISVYLFFVSWRLAALAWVVAPLVAMVNKAYGAWLHNNSKKTQTAIAEANEIAHQALSCVRTVFSFGNEAYEIARYWTKLQDYYRVSLQQGLMDGVYFMGISCFLMQTVMQGATLVGGIYLVLYGNMNSNRLIAVMFYQSQLMENINNLLNVFSNLYKSTGAAAKVFAILDRVPSRTPPADSVTPAHAPRGLVELKDVHFAYPSRPHAPVLRGFSFQVQPGSVVALVGSSGAGKSTTFHLIENFYKPDQGQVMLDGFDVHALNHSWLHRAVGLVGQEPVLFRCSIEENIVYSTFNPCSDMHINGPWLQARGAGADSQRPMQDTDPRIVEAAKVANAHDFISSLPEMYRTEVGERGVQLSGGQKQRVAIARAVLQDPRVLLLDEATSALDTESEALVQAALEKAMVGRSVLVIAHRLSTIMNADMIVVLDKGTVVEAGTHQELMSKVGGPNRTSYRNLVSRQFALASDSKNKLEETSVSG